MINNFFENFVELTSNAIASLGLRVTRAPQSPTKGVINAAGSSDTGLAIAGAGKGADAFPFAATIVFAKAGDLLFALKKKI
jgi:hypothetical protein